MKGFSAWDGTRLPSTSESTQNDPLISLTIRCSLATGSHTD